MGEVTAVHEALTQLLEARRAREEAGPRPRSTFAWALEPETTETRVESPRP
ncbi:MAG TPA: hypothetical protein VMB82_09625 [Acidimicrobiales bacterium]|nr:hypothetical protein [Acidimicrobiales bacterium]